MSENYEMVKILADLLVHVQPNNKNAKIFKYIITKYIVHLTSKYIPNIHNLLFIQTFNDKLYDLYINENIDIMKLIYDKTINYDNRFLEPIIKTPKKRYIYKFKNIIIYPDDIIDWECNEIYPFKNDNYLVETAKLFEEYFWIKVNIYESLYINIAKPLIYNSDNLCKICLDSLTDNNIKLLECGHIFHGNCYFEWSKFNISCPYCKK